jgi:N-acetylmuramoyl-L-alanine amidase
VTPIRRLILQTASALLLSTATCPAQTPAPPQATPTAPVTPQAQSAAPVPPRTLPAFYRNLILLDPAHGGPDTGAHLPDNALEKDVALAFAQRLRPIIAAQGFTVIATRDSDPAVDLTADQRAGTANHTRPLACILLHASATGSGIHIASSALTPLGDATPPRALPWQTAQAATLPMSLRLANEIGLALQNAHLPVVLLRASVPPIDNLICPAVAIEIAPSPDTPVTDATYQQHIAEAIASALASFRTHNAPPPAATPAPPPPPAPKPVPPAAAHAPSTAAPGAPQ